MGGPTAETLKNGPPKSGQLKIGKQKAGPPTAKPKTGPIAKPKTGPSPLLTKSSELSGPQP